jgi:lysozyme family protein
MLSHSCLYFLVVYGRCVPTAIDPESQELQKILNKTSGVLQDLVVGQTSVNILSEAKEVQLNVVCVRVRMFCVHILRTC